MTKQTDIIQKEHIYLLKGELDFSNVMSVYEKSLRCFSNPAPLIFDFSQLQSNSAGIALIVEWVKLAKRQQKQIQIKNLPNHLHEIIKAAGMQELFDI